MSHAPVFDTPLVEYRYTGTWYQAQPDQKGAEALTYSEKIIKPYLIIAYPKQKMSLVFGRQNQTGRIGSTTRVMKPECTDWFLNKLFAKNNQQRRSLDHVHTRTSSLHRSISAHTQMKHCRWGEGKHAVCPSREEGCLPPRSRRSRASMTCRRQKRAHLCRTACAIPPTLQPLAINFSDTPQKSSQCIQEIG